jgi:hypothetical protein
MKVEEESKTWKKKKKIENRRKRRRFPGEFHFLRGCSQSPPFSAIGRTLNQQCYVAEILVAIEGCAVAGTCRSFTRPVPVSCSSSVSRGAGCREHLGMCFFSVGVVWCWRRGHGRSVASRKWRLKKALVSCYGRLRCKFAHWIPCNFCPFVIRLASEPYILLLKKGEEELIMFLSAHTMTKTFQI